MKTVLLAAVLFVLTVRVAHAGTVAYYRFEEGTNGMHAASTNSIYDSSGNGLNASPVGQPIYSNNVAVSAVRPNNLSLRFSPVRRVFIPDYPHLQLTNSLTLEAFIEAEAYSDNSSLGESQIIFRGDDNIALDPYFIELRFTNLFFAVTSASNEMASVQAPFNLHQWHHVAGTLDGATGNLRLYIDGGLVAATNTAIRPYKTLTGRNPGLGIGDVQSDNIASEYFNGFIDEVRISDTALAPSQFLIAPALMLHATRTGSTLQLDLDVAAGSSQSFSLLQAGQPGGPWTTNSTAVLTTNGPGSYTYRITPGSDTSQFYRVRSP